MKTVEGTESNLPDSSVLESGPTEKTAQPSGAKRGRGGSSAKKVSGGALPQFTSDPSRPKQVVNLQTLLEAGAHFGHQTARWSPTMAPYIYTSRNGIHIINLPKTVQYWERARKIVENVVARGGNVLFVGTKKQAQEAVMDEARRCGAYFVSKRWLGGMLTNFQTIRKSIERMNKVAATLAEEEAAIASGGTSKFTKKERLMMSRELEKLEFSLGGIKDMHSSPSLMFVIDIKREDIAIKEARRLDIPVVALVDTNCDPSTVNYPIPSNDDGSRVIRLFCAAVADAVIEGRKLAGERKIDFQQSKGHKAEAAVASDAGAAVEASPAEQVGEGSANVES